LYSNTAHSIFEDSKGRLCRGCKSQEGGLHIYNRAKDNFIRVLPDPYIPAEPGEDNIRVMVQDPSGILWLGTNNGVRLFNPDDEVSGFEEIKNKVSFPAGLQTGLIEDISMDAESNLWFGNASGLYMYEVGTGKFHHYEHSEKNPFSLGDNRVRDICEYPNGILWIGTWGGGLNRLVRPESGNMDPAYVRFDRYRHDPSDPASISSDAVLSLNIDPSGSLWIGTWGEGINKLIPAEESSQSDLLQPLVKFQSFHTNPLDNESLNYNFVQCIYFDASGTMWVGTTTGLNREKRYKFSHFRQDISEDGLASNKIQAIFEDNEGTIWIGSSRGLNQFNREDNTLKYIMSGAILSISQDRQGFLWIAQWHDGLIRYNKMTGQVVSYRDGNNQNSIGADNLFTTFVDSDNDIWICTWGGGLNRYNRTSDDFTQYRHSSTDPNSLSNDYVSTIIEDTRGHLWVGTLQGLNKMDKQEGSFISYRHDPEDNHSLSHNFVNCIHEASDGTLWVGTTEGLNKMNEDGSFINYTRSNGLPDDGIMGILEDDHGDLWISTADGIFKIIFSRIEELDDMSEILGDVLIISSSALNDPNRLLIKRYSVDDGLQSKEFVPRTALRSRNGEMLFGGINGFNVFHPDSITDNMHPPEVVFTNLQLFNRDVSLGDVFNRDTILTRTITETEELVLSYKNNVFSIEFAALSFVAPEQNQFAYMLEGFEDRWNFVGTERKASYTNLNHGQYALKVKAANNDGVWSKQEASMLITIKPPFWKTWWFKVSVILLVLCAALGIIEMRLYSIKKQKRVLESEVKVRTRQVVEQRDHISEQTERIKRMNELLQKHNIELEDEMHHLSEARVMQKLIGFEEFKKIYPDEATCCKFLEELKWKDGYTCKKCGGHDYRKDEVTLMRRCAKCNYKESVTTCTVFHRLRFPIDKAFYILILTSTGREINISQLAHTINLRMKTCWEFHNKVKDIMQTRKRFKNPKEGWKELILLPGKKMKTGKLPSPEDV
jgi:ligand-binding sensor domain-containing protein